MTPTQQPLPQSPDDLAVLACASDQPPQRREDALAALLPLIHQVARQVGHPFHDGRFCEDLFEQSASHVQKALPRFQPGPGHSFERWLRTVLYHLACDIRRRQQARPDALDLAHTGHTTDEQDPLAAAAQSAAEDVDAADHLAEGFRRMREVLDRITWPPGREVDTFAVWLFLLRQRIGACFAEALAQQFTEPGELVGQIACWLPWHADEIARRFRAAWPTLEDCWQAIGELFDRGNLTPPAVVEALAQLVGSAAISLSLWNQWTHRARKHARERLQPGEWETLFARWIFER